MHLKILLSAYSCGPNRGSEPGVGWNAAVSLAKHAEIHVLTTFEFQQDIETEISSGRVPETLHFHFYDLPGARWWWKHGSPGIDIHYAVWQLLAGNKVRRLHSVHNFNSAQHVTLVRYWAPSCLRNAGIPYIFGPVAGADLPAEGLVHEYPWKERCVFAIRKAVRWIGEHMPSVRSTLKNARLILAATPKTRERCIELGIQERKIGVCQAIALSNAELHTEPNENRHSAPVFAGVGGLIHRKRFDIAIRAFAKAAVSGSRLVLIGDGREKTKLQELAEACGVSSDVDFAGHLTRSDALKRLRQCDVLLHPCDLESGGCVVQEAMAAALPVICLDHGGPAMMVDDSTGVKIRPDTTESIVDDVARAMRTMSDRAICEKLSAAARNRAVTSFSWENKSACYFELHRKLSIGEIPGFVAGPTV